MPHHALSETQTQTLWRIASGAPLRETIDELAHALQAVSPGLRVAVIVVERDADGDAPPHLRLAGAPSMSDLYRAGINATPLEAGASPSADVVLSNRPLFIQSSDDARVGDVMRDYYRRFGIKAAYLAPLKDPQTNDVIGVFCLYPNHTGAPTPEETTLLTLGASLAALAISRDNAERARKRSEDTLAQLMQGLRLQATTDALTGLPNRAQFLETLAHTLDEARQTGGVAASPAVLFIDLDRFKLVNDTLGHAAGDQLLGEMATRLTQCVTKHDTVARIGGDEFVVLIARTDSDRVRKTARQLRSVATKPVMIGAQEAFVGASVGVALWASDETVTAEALLKNADTAMYHAKQEGGHGYALYTLAMGDAVLDRATLEADLRRALTRGELSLAFQPQFDLITKRMIGVEALVRWNHPRRGAVAPADFIPVAEESGLIEPLGEWVLREACRHGARWQTLPRPLRIAVNLSPKQFSPRNTIALQVKRVLAETGFDPSLLDLEITESVLLTKTVPVSDTLKAIKSLGVHLLLDDFGTGYGSLLYLRQFPLDVLKVDSSFVQGLSQSREDAAIVRAVIDLAHALGMRVVAEGVETADQLAELALLGCDALQGFLFSRPLPPEEIERLLQETEEPGAKFGR